MMRRILQDYFAAFRWGNVKERLKGNGFLIVYVIIISPLIYRDVLESIQRGVLYYLTLLPMLFAALSALIHPMTLPKLIYLIPMGEKERRDYIRRSYRLNITIPVLAGILCQSILMAAGWTNAIMAGMVVLEILLTALLFGLTGRASASWDERAKQKETIKEFRRWGLLAEIVTLFLLYLLPICAGAAMEKWELRMVMVSIFLIQLPLVFMVMRGYPKAEAQAVNYEHIQKIERETESHSV